MTDEEKTIFAVRLNKSKTELVWLLLLLLVFALVMTIIGYLQYNVCVDKNPDVTLRECFSLTKVEHDQKKKP